MNKPNPLGLNYLMLTSGIDEMENQLPRGKPTRYDLEIFFEFRPGRSGSKNPLEGFKKSQMKTFFLVFISILRVLICYFSINVFFKTQRKKIRYFNCNICPCIKFSCLILIMDIPY